MSKRERHPTLLALTSSAMLLPAYQFACADAPPEQTSVGIRFSTYEEDDISASNTTTGPSERYQIDIAQFHLLAPVGDNWSLALDVQYEDMSGASPWFVGTSFEGEQKVIMSGASIEDTRTDVSVTTRYYYDRGNIGANYRRSDEDDYTANSFGVDASFNSSDDLTTYSFSLSSSDDELEPTQGTTPTKTLQDKKDIRSAWIGVSRIISKRAIMRFGLSYTYREGFLTDTYKFNDQRPDERKEWVWSGGYRQHFVAPNAALHVDYRYFDDDWDIKSHTLDLAWHQNIGSSSRLVPYLRYYSQGEADFFDNKVDFDAQYYADDYRLSSYGAVTTGLRVVTRVNDWKLHVAGERYTTRGNWGLYAGDEAPGLVKYWRFSVGLDYSFD